MLEITATRKRNLPIGELIIADKRARTDVVKALLVFGDSSGYLVNTQNGGSLAMWEFWFPPVTVMSSVRCPKDIHD